MQSKFTKPLNVVLAVAIVLAAVAVLYLVRQVASLPDEARVSALIEERLAQRLGNKPPGALTEQEVSALIDKHVAQRLAERPSRALSDEGFNARVEKSIAAIVEKRRRAERERSSQLTGKVRPVDGNDHVYGNPEAPVTLIEYSDFECPFCKRFHATMKKTVEASNGQLKWVYRHFPIDQLHPVKARKTAVASECAAELGGNEEFWKFADRFFELTPSNSQTDTDKVLPQIAREIGLDEARFASCVASDRHNRRIEEDYRNAVATGGNGTPWSIVISKNGKTYPLSGARPEAAVKQLVELALREK